MTNIAYDTDAELVIEEAAKTSADMMALRPVPRISIQAFCESEGVANALDRAGDDRRMAKTHLMVHMGGIPAAMEFFQTAPTPNLLILESRSAPRNLMDELANLSEVCDPATKVVIVGHYNDVALYRDLVRSGVSEYVIAPISMAEILAVISAIFVDPEAAPIGRSIAFIGAKGGVGSSTIAHMSPGPSPICSSRRLSSPISTCHSARPTSISIRTPLKALPRPFSRRSASMKSIWIGSWRSARNTYRCWRRHRRSTALTISNRMPLPTSSIRRNAVRRRWCSMFPICGMPGPERR